MIKYPGIAAKLRQRARELAPGDRMPSEAEATTEFGVSRMTIRAAYRVLVDEGLVAVNHGRGVFVAEPSGLRVELRNLVDSWRNTPDGEKFADELARVLDKHP